MRSFLQYKKKKAIVVAVALAAAAMTTQAQTSSDAPTSFSETYNNWVVRCVTQQVAEGQSATRICEMTQELRQQKNNQRILTMVLQAKKGIEARLGTGVASLTIIAPFGLLFSEGVKLNLLESTLVSISYKTCLPTGCIAVSDLTIDQINELSKADKTTVIMTDTNNQVLKLSLSMAGFRAAWKRLEKL